MDSEKQRERKRAYTALRYAGFKAMRQALADKQSGLCACGTPLDNDPCLDHDHRCCPGKPRDSCRNCDRGVLHRNCNRILGLVGEDAERLRKLADYLDKHGRPTGSKLN